MEPSVRILPRVPLFEDAAIEQTVQQVADRTEQILRPLQAFAFAVIWREGIAVRSSSTFGLVAKACVHFACQLSATYIGRERATVGSIETEPIASDHLFVFLLFHNGPTEISALLTRVRCTHMNDHTSWHQSFLNSF